MDASSIDFLDHGVFRHYIRRVALMDVIWFVVGLVIGAVVGSLLGYCIACLSILQKTSVRDCKERERDNESHE